MMTSGKYSLGMGDRFARQARAQLRACVQAGEQGREVIPVWNKSNREHLTIGSEPSSVREAAEAAVRHLRWNAPYFVDADHIRLDTVDRFIPHSDYFTLDVADFIGQPAEKSEVEAFVQRHGEWAGPLEIPGLERPLQMDRAGIERVAGRYLLAVREAARIHRRLENAKGAGGFITEVSMDETEHPQTPPELLLILAALADEGVPVQAIAPKFTGRFNKGVDYEGDLARFEQEFNADLAVLAWASVRYGLPNGLKLSVHSGSDKFSIYPPIRGALARFDAGLHLKTAGTTWLEEVIGLAEAGQEGLALAREIYADAFDQREELCAPYASVIAIDPARLPAKQTVRSWSAEEFVAALRHDPACPQFNPHLRQLLHVGYKVAAKMGKRYLERIEACEESIARNVTENLYRRHLQPLFL